MQPGLSARNGYSLLFAAFLSIFFLAFLNFIQPYILTEILHIPGGEQGKVSASMALIQEIVLLTVVGPFGVLADRIGRRKVALIGYLITACGYMLYPFATSIEFLTLSRMVFAVGVGGVLNGINLAMAIATGGVHGSFGPNAALTPGCGNPEIAYQFAIPTGTNEEVRNRNGDLNSITGNIASQGFLGYSHLQIII